MAEMTEREKATNAKEDLLKLLQRKATVKEELQHLENTIYDFEGAYLSDTRDTGNIVEGWAKLDAKNRKKRKSDPVKDEHRIFSSSSNSSAAAVKSSCSTPMASKIKIEPGSSCLDISGDDKQKISHFRVPAPPALLKRSKRCLSTADKSKNVDVKLFGAGN